MLFSVLANLAIICSEYLHRSVPAGTPWIKIIPYVLPFYAIAQYSLFKSYSAAPHWFTAWMVFSVGNSLMRIVAVKTFAPGEVTSWTHVVLGVTGMLCGAWMLKEGLK